MKQLFALFILLFTTNGFAQLSGTAFLSGQSNHAGIKVKFIANSGPAVTDSCLTNAAGNYSINIAGGVYKVFFSCAGYQAIFYNNAASVVLGNSTVLNATTLSPGNSVYVNGNVSGNWVSTNTYYVQSDLTIPLNNSLFIQPGTTVKFMGNYQLTSNGTLLAIGSAASRILFTAADSTSPWKMVDLNNSASVASYCTVEYCSNGFRFGNTSPTISNCILRNISVGAIYSVNGAAKIYNNEIYKYALFGIWCEGSSTGTISCNNLHEGNYKNNVSSNSYGIISKSDNLVHNNKVINGGAAGIWVSNTGNPLIKNNYVKGSTNGIDVGNSLSQGPGPKMINNTLVNNQTALLQSGSAAATQFINNIVVGGSTGINFPGTITIDHNLFYNCAVNFTNVGTVGLGQVVGNNSNGDPMDSYYNIFLDPQFVPAAEPQLQASSPALNAGNTAYDASMGADSLEFCVNLVTGIDKADAAPYNFPVIYPNPSDGIYMLKLTAPAEITVYDALGKVIFAGTFASGENALNLAACRAGVYFLRVSSGGRPHTTKLILE